MRGVERRALPATSRVGRRGDRPSTVAIGVAVGAGQACTSWSGADRHACGGRPSPASSCTRTPRDRVRRVGGSSIFREKRPAGVVGANDETRVHVVAREDVVSAIADIGNLSRESSRQGALIRDVERVQRSLVSCSGLSRPGFLHAAASHRGCRSSGIGNESRGRQTSRQIRGRRRKAVDRVELLSLPDRDRPGPRSSACPRRSRRIRRGRRWPR